MKIIQEYIIKIVVLCIVSVLIIESFITFLLVKRAELIYNSVYNETMYKTEEKSIEITKKIEEYATNLLTRYMTDLKLICKHALLLNGKENSTDDDVINEDSDILKNSNKNILISIEKELNNTAYIHKYYSDKNTYDYAYYYEQEFNLNPDRNYVLKNLSDSHEELNSIGFYNFEDNDVSLIKEEEKISIKYIMSILKTIFIRRYIIKRMNMDYIRFFILNQNKIYIYPPEAYNNTNIFFFEFSYPTGNCNFSEHNKNKSQQFPLCVYNYFNNKLINATDNYLIIVKEKIILEKNFAALCLKIRLLRNQKNESYVCSELEFSSIFNTANFDVPEKFEFGMFTFSNDIIVPLVYSKRDIYAKIIAIFNDTENKKNRIELIKNSQTFSLYHFLYYNLTETLKNHTELTLNEEEIAKEYNEIINKIHSEISKFRKIGNSSNIIMFNFNKTICQKQLLNNDYEFIKDEYKMIIIPLSFEIRQVNEDMLETEESVDKNMDLYIYSIISTNPKINREKLMKIINIKIERVILLFTFFTIIILAFYLLLLSIISNRSLQSINEIIIELKKAEISSGGGKNYILEEDKIPAPNAEMLELKTIYETMRKILIIKQAFEKEYYLDKHNLEFYNLVIDIKKKDIKEICTSFLGFYHFKNDSFNLAETEFRSTLYFIQEKENKIISGKNNEFDDKIKDAIKRSSTESYINEYSIFEKIDENMLAIIKIKILKQRFIYLYAMTKFKLGCEMNSMTGNISSLTPGGNLGVSGNKNKLKKDKDKRINYFKEAINYFTECKNINILLGINQIKVIYSLIMISKCYMQLNDYKNSVNNINEALSLFFELSKSFKENHSKNYNPKIMLFIENNIFHYILFSMERICYVFNRPYACNWLILKIFETSPFLISNVHYNSGMFIQYYLERNKLKITKSESKFVKGANLLKEYEKAKKYFAKVVSRMNIKNMNINKRSYLNEKMLSETNHSTSYRTKSEIKTEKSFFSSTLKRDYQTGKVSSFHFKNKNLSKIITFCLSEKILKKVNGLELKDVIIKYFQKYFAMNETDKFSFIQFANNGKKTIHFKMEQLDYFLLKIQKTKNTFELTDSYITNSNLPFMELFNIFDSIIKNYPATEEINTDNIIIMFINSDDIRFTSMTECINIVEELNKKNASVFLLSYDEDIKREKINNIHSFLNGLFEGYFFQIKNYQQIKQIFINISTIKYQSNFFGYDFDSLDHTL